MEVALPNGLSKGKTLNSSDDKKRTFSGTLRIPTFTLYVSKEINSPGVEDAINEWMLYCEEEVKKYATTLMQMSSMDNFKVEPSLGKGNSHLNG